VIFLEDIQDHIFGCSVLDLKDHRNWLSCQFLTFVAKKLIKCIG